MKSQRSAQKKSPVRNLFTTGNPKTEKGAARGFLTAVLHLAPYDVSGIQVCPMAAIAGCVRACLNTAGRGGIAAGGMVTYDSAKSGAHTNHIQRARIARTRFWAADQDGFMSQIAREIRSLEKRATRHGLKLAVRMNGTSDLRWEDMPCEGHPNVMAAFPHIQFYDYTKIPNRLRHGAIPNYYLTFSHSGREEFAPFTRKILSIGLLNVAVCFDRKAPLPAFYFDRPVIDGDAHDLRFLDPSGVVVALKAKGNARYDRDGFVVYQ